MSVSFRSGGRFALAISLMALGLVPALGSSAMGDLGVVLGEAGDLDPSFGDGGIVGTEAGTAFDVAIQPDGKFLVAGANVGEVQAIRYNEDGSLDPTFGGDGIITHSLGDSANAKGVAVQADGKVVLVGSASVGLKSAIVLLRYDENGVLDASFGDGGVVQTRYSDNDYAEAVAIQPDGNILVAGRSGPSWNSDFALLRYLPDGSLDPSFGDGGLVLTPFEGLASAEGLSLSPDGDIVVGGHRGGPGGSEFAAARNHPDGSLDTSFDGDGTVTTEVSPGFAHVGSAVALQVDGKTVLAGYTYGGSGYDIAVLRYEANGQLDSGFGGDGVVLTSIDDAYSDFGSDTVIQADDKILVVGSTGNSDIALLRYESDGSLDSNFGDGGIVTTTIESSDHGNALALQPDGKVIVAGSASSNVALLRYFGEPPIASTLLLSVEPSQIDLGESVSISGNLSFADGQSVDGKTIHITRSNPDGSETSLLDVTTDLSGDFSTVDTPVSFGPNTYIATFDGDGTHDSATAEALVQVVTLASPSDFNGDGLSDLAIGAMGEDAGGVGDTGAINVLYATDTGLDDVGNQFWDQTSTGSASNGIDDGFGFASASGDFNGDGFADAAVSAPYKDVGGIDGAGAVSVLYGSASGLAAAGSQQWTQNSTDVEDDAEADDNLGWSVAAGDFNGDGFDDLASGIPGEIVGGKNDAGAVSVLYGSLSGLTATEDQRWTQNSSFINNKAETNDQFGLAVGTGDFNGDGFADLAVGVPTENLDNGDFGGAVNVIYGSVAGLTSSADDFWNQDVTGINNKVEAGDLFGYRVAGGDFDGDGFDDLLTSVVAEDISGQADAGGVSAIYGSASGLAAAGDDFWHQDSTGIANEAEVGDEFGVAIATGDFDGDGFDDAAMGVIGEDVSGETDSGGVAVIYGTSGGLDDPNDDFWHQDSAGIEDQAEEPDWFGYSLMAANFGNGPQDDLAIGAVLETVGSGIFAGAVNVIYGSPSDLISTGDQFWHQDSAGILDSAETDDWFGFGLAQPGAGAGPSGGPARGVATPANLLSRLSQGVAPPSSPSG